MTPRWGGYLSFHPRLLAASQKGEGLFVFTWRSSMAIKFALLLLELQMNKDSGPHTLSKISAAILNCAFLRHICHDDI